MFSVPSGFGRHNAARPSGDLGGLARGIPPDPAVQVVELARQLRCRANASPEVGRYHNGASRSRLAKARGRVESELDAAQKATFRIDRAAKGDGASRRTSSSAPAVFFTC